MTNRQTVLANNQEILRRLGLDLICPPATELVITLRVNEFPQIQITAELRGRPLADGPA